MDLEELKTRSIPQRQSRKEAEKHFTMKSKSNECMNCEQIAPSANNCYSDKMIFKMIDVAVTIRHDSMVMLEKA